MIPSPDKNRATLVRLVSSGAVIQTLEAPLPYPIPGARFGFGNITTLIALFLAEKKRLTFSDCLVVVFSRILTSSFLSGNFLTPGFLISAIASPLSFVAMYLLSLTGIFSVVGVSIGGAVVHNLSQLVVVYIFFAREISLLSGWLPTILVIAGLVSGSITGFLALKMINDASGVSSSENNDDSYPLSVPGFAKNNSGSPKSFPLRWFHLFIAFGVVIFSVVIKGGKVLFLLDLFLFILVVLRLKFSAAELAKRYSAFVPFGLAIFIMALISVGKFTAGIVPFLRVFVIFQVSTLIFFDDIVLGSLWDFLNKEKLYGLSKDSFIFRIVEITTLALAAAPSMREDILNLRKLHEKGEGLKRMDFYKKLIEAIIP